LYRQGGSDEAGGLQIQLSQVDVAAVLENMKQEPDSSCNSSLGQVMNNDPVSFIFKRCELLYFTLEEINQCLIFLGSRFWRRERKRQRQHHFAV
jgi:hypothetical protein